MQELKPYVKSRFFSLKELLLYIFIFTCVCFLLFPKGKLEEYALTEEKTNVELYAIYIKNLLRIQNDPLLRLHLVGSLTQARSFQEAEEEAKKLIDTNYKDRANMALYKIEKTKFFSGEGGDRGKMQAYIIEAIEATRDTNLLREINKEALSMDMPLVVMLSSEKLYRTTGNLEWLIQAYRYAVALKDTDKAIIYASELYVKDKTRRESYIKDVVYIIKSNKKSMQLLESLSKKLDTDFYKRVTQFMLQTEQQAWTNSIHIEEYRKLFSHAKTYHERKVLFTKIVRLYLWKGDYQGLKNFISSYYKEFAKDEEVAKLVLKASLATGDAIFAKDVAEGIKEELLR